MSSLECVLYITINNFLTKYKRRRRATNPTSIPLHFMLTLMHNTNTDHIHYTSDIVIIIISSELFQKSRSSFVELNPP